MLVTSDAQAAGTDQSLDQADALRAMPWLTAIYASVVVATDEQTSSPAQAIDATEALRAQWAAPPLAVVGSCAEPTPMAVEKHENVMLDLKRHARPY